MKKQKKTKQKTKKALVKRFKVTKKGKVLHRSHNIRHIRSPKSKSQIRRLKRTKSLFKTFALKIRKFIGK
jgi:large subunit ribosomal protein L35